MEIFKLFGSIFVDSSAADNSIQKTTDKASSFASKLGAGITTVAKWGTAVVAAAGVAVGGMVKFASSAASSLDTIDKMSQKLGVSREAYQELEFIMSQCGADVNSFQTGMKSLLTNMDKVNEGNATAIDNFSMLGVSVQNTDGTLRNQEEVLWDTISAFQAMEDSAEKNRLAQELFGKQGQELMPLLNSEAGSMEELKDKAHELGLVLSDEMVDKGVELTDSLDQTKRALKSITTSIGASLIPIVLKLSQKVQDALPVVKEHIGNIASWLTEHLTPAIEYVQGNIQALADVWTTYVWPAITTVVDAFVGFVTTIYNAVQPAISDIITKFTELYTAIQTAVSTYIVPFIQSFIDMIQSLWQENQDKLNMIAVLFQTVFDVIAGLVAVFVDTFKGYILPFLTWFTECVTNNMDSIKGIFQAVFDVIGGIVSAFISLFTGDWTGLWESIKGILSSAADFMTSTVSTAFNLICDVFSPLTDFFSDIWESIKGVCSDAWDSITGMFTKVGVAISDAVTGTIKSAINSVLSGAIGIINGFIGAINSVIGVINDIPGVELNKLDKLEVPQLEQGGVLEKGQIGLLEGNGAEAVVPLDQNQKWINKVAQDMESAIGGSKSNEKLDRLIDLMEQLVGIMPEVANTSIILNNREFGRAVRQVNA